MNKINHGVIAALLAAALFGASTPLAKLLLAHTGPWLLAALLYLGSGIGLWLVRVLQRAPRVHLARGDRIWLAGAIAAGGVVAPLLLMLGLAQMPASGAALLLNGESVFTALLAWIVFKENVDKRIVLGMVLIVAGAAILAAPGGNAQIGSGLPALAVLGACLMWGIDNNLTRRVALTDASFIAMSKGLVAGTTNLLLALASGAQWPAATTVIGAGVLGFASYGASLTLFVIALRHLGTARTGAYFSVAPFFGAVLAVLLGEAATLPLLIAGALMLMGVVLHLIEQHEHTHTHEAMAHSHAHTHGVGDVHHEHVHENSDVAPGTRHSHWHQHFPITHTHAHFPDAHHRHRHAK